MKERADDIVGVDTTHTLDVTAGARLAVGHHRKRLQRRGGEPRFLARGVGGQASADLRRGDQLPGIVVVLQADAALVLLEPVSQRGERRLGLQARHAGELSELGGAPRALGDEEKGLVVHGQVVGQVVFAHAPGSGTDSMTIGPNRSSWRAVTWRRRTSSRVARKVTAASV